MSRIGRQAVAVPAGVTVAVDSDSLVVKGPKGELTFPLFTELAVAVEDGSATVSLSGNGSARKASALWGLTRAHLSNMVHGVTEGWEKKLQIVGVGWQARLEGRSVNLQIGFCHPVVMPVPEGLEVEVPQGQEIVVRGADKQAVGLFTAQIRAVRPPEPYKGKGIRYSDEQVRRKAGKSFAAGVA